MTDFMNRLTQMLSTPWVPWIILGVIAVGVLLGQVQKHVPDDPIARIKKTFGADDMPHVVALAIVLLWAALGAVLAAGLLTLLAEIAWGTVRPETPAGESDFRFLLTKTTALTAVLGGLIALPFTALRLKHTATQTRHAADVLFNEKLNDANTDLHARYQTTEKQEDGTYVDIWKDDIVRRNGAIDRLEALAVEDPSFAPRIARILCVYLKEMSSEHRAEEMPQGLYGVAIRDWARGLTVKRSDMETAAQVLGRLHDKTGVPAKDLAIDLSRVNLQAMRLSELNFEHATMNGVKLNGAELSGASLNGDTDLTAVHATGAALRAVNLKGVPKLEDLVTSAFGDASVILPDDIKHLVKDTWPDEELDDKEYHEEWNRFAKELKAYVPPQRRTPLE
ncbi:MAG: pentapeptide repeat-containing protein [Alphaproteobacteria bacterium]|nr:pentapeptide repeat-containing protein [Alphaproteobacteria bacterium]MBU1573219.1 pentapeptide repeat-containing protein [Alphaproteobacteria bacterium]MBU2079823.1 pentapeptide repeat-containing protein [Alphaproteobacteria bacterium]MBU2162597.1 pentapeptide repeat-containing protein [Alphaproteobacteria bacterium]MBU2241719.1 pentapeptide repeat-containing protein [Alphaproteobacteria bacterium]